MNQKNFIELLKNKNKLDFKPIFYVYQNMGPDFNERSLRYFKGKIVEILISYLDEQLEHVDRIGYDIIYVYTNYDKEENEEKIEVKSSNQCLTYKDGFFKDTLNNIKIKNKLSNKEDIPYQKTFDYLVVVDENAIAVAMYNDISDYIVPKGDSVDIVHCPIEKFHILDHIPPNFFEDSEEETPKPEMPEFTYKKGYAGKAMEATFRHFIKFWIDRFNILYKDNKEEIEKMEKKLIEFEKLKEEKKKLKEEKKKLKEEKKKLKEEKNLTDILKQSHDIENNCGQPYLLDSAV